MQLAAVCLLEGTVATSCCCSLNQAPCQNVALNLCSRTCLSIILPYYGPICQKHFHAICSNTKCVKADKLGLTSANSILCQMCASTKLHLGQPGSPIPTDYPEPAQKQYPIDDIPGTQFDDKIDETQQKDEVPRTQPQKNESEPRSSERLQKQRDGGNMPNYLEVIVSCFPEVVSQLTATQLMDARTVGSDNHAINIDTQGSVVSTKCAHKLLSTRVLKQYEVNASGMSRCRGWDLFWL
jgi:hypothetical protein